MSKQCVLITIPCLVCGENLFHENNNDLKALIVELTELEIQASLRSNDLLREESRRNFSRATADAYAYCIMRLRQIT